MNFYYYRPIAIILSETSKLTSKHLSRQPHAKTEELTSVKYAKRNIRRIIPSETKRKSVKLDVTGNKNSNDQSKGSTEKVDIVDSPNENSKIKLTTDDEEMDYNISDENITNLERANATNDVKSEKNLKNTPVEFMKCNRKKSSKLSNVIEKLIGRVAEKPINITTTKTGLGIHFSSSSRSNELFFPHQHVSPRKRILREFEKVSLEDRNSTTQKRSRSKSNASTDFASVSNSKASGNNYSIVVAQQTASISCNNKESNNQVSNGSPTRSNIVNSTSSNASKNSHASSESTAAPVSKPISNYSIISLLGHNSDSRSELNTEDRSISENRGSPRSPMSYNHQILSSSRSTLVSKKKSPTNTANTLVNSPTNYRNARSPDINSPSPGLQQNSHHNRYHPASLSSPTSSFHPYLSSSRGSPISSGTLSPTDLYRHRPYRTAGSPSTISNSSALPHQYASLNGSPTAFANRYSPSTYSSSTKTSPTQSSQSHSLSSVYNVNLLPQSYEMNNSIVNETHRYSPNLKHRSSDWSPVRSSATSGRGSPSNYANSNNSLSTTTIPKKTASIRQKYGSLSPNGYAGGGNSIENTLFSKTDSNSAKKEASDIILDAKPLTKRSKSPIELHKKPQPRDMYDKDLQARYNAEVAAMHHQSLIASALQQQVGNPFYHMYTGANLHAGNMPSSMSAAAYMNPLYYHHPTNEMFRKAHPSAAMDLLHKNIVPTWIDPYNASSMMQYPSMQGPGLLPDKSALTAKSQSDVHSILMPPFSLNRSANTRDQQHIADIDMWNVANAKKSPVMSPALTTTTFRRQSQQFSDCEPISLIKDEPSSGNYNS